MDVAAPHRAVVAGLDGDVLVLLAGRAAAMSGREIAQALGQRSHEGVRKSLERLVRQGIVQREAAGNALMHRLNREHVGAAAVMTLASMRSELWSRLRSTIGEWAVTAIHASVFGSAARGDGTADSDIDLFIVRHDEVDADDARWRDQLDGLGELVRTWTGNSASLIEQSAREVRDLATRPRPPAVIDELRRDGIDLVGEPIRTLLRREAR
jgi:predicted nucleotidyltransferase